ncbi:BTAD domain-containing putative transcriptional regulator [Actinoplanes sp. CA-030573]|uniref:BTAD domain-containing putative transcriptional regulator n=1 Tax=Actinoplanes sp. CA-030573 TaxID=3239898 RepID=UPI003D8FB79C
MRLRLLGGFAVDRDGVPVPAREWRLRKARTLVKLLALAPGHRMHRDELLQLLWPDRDPASAVNNLHQAMHVARRALGDDDLLRLQDDIVAMGAVTVDVTEFERLAAGARDLAGLRATIGAYAGDLLPEDRFEEWAIPRREQLRGTLCELLVDLAEQAGEAEAVAAAQRALAIDPRHERAVRALIRRLAAAGRRSEALARYERLREDLLADYGTDPDPETRRLYRELLTGSRETGEREGGAREGGAKEPGHNLGSPLTSFVGREREIAEVHRLLAPGGLVTLTGVGGAGKTRLAEEAARRLLRDFPDGVWFADLAGVSDPRLVADTVGAAVGLDPAAGADPVRTLTGRLAGRRLLLILDNCEHLLSSCAALAAAVRRGCPGVTLLATSREPLRVPGEVTFRVPSLEVPAADDRGDPGRLAALPSVRLFLDRARDVRPGFALDDGNAAYVMEICRRLDGIPLALELAAARMSHLESAEIAERLTGALSLLGRRGELTRHATLRAALEWSHALLAADEQILLRRLAVFAGSFSLTAAEQVCADPPPADPPPADPPAADPPAAGPMTAAPSPAGDRLPRGDVLDCLGRLVDKSLVQIEPAGDRSRYRLLETIRQLARERLVAAGEAAEFEDAHCRHFTRIAVDSDPDRAAGLVLERPQRLDVDHDNLRAALAWAERHDPGRALLLAVSLWRYWLARGHFVEGADRLERVIEAAPTPSPLRARALFALAVLHGRRGSGDRMRSLGDAGVADAERTGEPIEIARARLMRGLLLLGVADPDEAERIALAGTPPEPTLVATAHWLAAQAALSHEDAATARRRFATCLDALGQVDRAAPPFLPAVTMCVPLIPLTADHVIPVFEESWLLGRRVGAVQGIAYAFSALGYAHRLAGDLAGARDAVERSVEAFALVDDDAGLAHALNHLGCVERDARRFDAAGKHLREALRLREQIGDRRGENLSLAALGLLAAAAGDAVEGRRVLAVALDRGAAVDDEPGVGGALLNMAVVELFAGERDRARQLVEQAVTTFSPQGFLRLEAWSRLLLAELGDPAGARIARDLFERLGCRIGLPRAERLLSAAK